MGSSEYDFSLQWHGVSSLSGQSLSQVDCDTRDTDDPVSISFSNLQPSTSGTTL